MARRRSERRVFFAWERSAVIFRGVELGRARPVFAALAMMALLLILGAREQRNAGIRSTRAALGVVHVAVSAYRADHAKRCPPTLADLAADGYLRGSATDAWGHSLRLICPGRRDPQGYDLSSDGPDGVVGGLDRVE